MPSASSLKVTIRPKRKREERQERIFAATQTFEVVARMWLKKTAANGAATTRVKVIGWLEKDVFPYLGTAPVSIITPRDVLVAEVRAAMINHNTTKRETARVDGADRRGDSQKKNSIGKRNKLVRTATCSTNRLCFPKRHRRVQTG